MADQATWEDRPKEIELMEEMLSDGSTVFAVEVREYEQVIKFDCLDKHHAQVFYYHLTDMLDSHTVNDYKML